MTSRANAVGAPGRGFEVVEHQQGDTAAAATAASR